MHLYVYAYLYTFIHLSVYGCMSVHVEGKIMFILCLTEHNAMMMYGVQYHTFSTHSLDYDEFYALTILPYGKNV
jgi:hypothetical protein